MACLAETMSSTCYFILTYSESGFLPCYGSRVRRIPYRAHEVWYQPFESERLELFISGKSSPMRFVPLLAMDRFVLTAVLRHLASIQYVLGTV